MQTHRQHGDNISLHLYSQYKENSMTNEPPLFNAGSSLLVINHPVPVP
jgi:hypothetical protein